MFSEFEYMNLSFVLQYHCLGSFSHFFGFHHSLQCPADARSLECTSASHWELEWMKKLSVNLIRTQHSDFWHPKLERSVKLFNLIICSKSYTCRTPSHKPSAYLPAPPMPHDPPPVKVGMSAYVLVESSLCLVPHCRGMWPRNVPRVHNPGECGETEWSLSTIPENCGIEGEAVTQVK